MMNLVRRRFFDLSYCFGFAEWDIGTPQPDLVALEAEGGIRGEVLDVGCGTGDNAIYLAQRGHDVVGVDASTVALRTARRRAQAAGARVAFVSRDAFALASLGRTFDTVLDYGLLHQFRGAEVPRYVSSLASVVRSGGAVVVQCFSDRGPRESGPGPRQLSEADLRRAFAGGWTVAWIRPATYRTSVGRNYEAWLASVTRD